MNRGLGWVERERGRERGRKRERGREQVVICSRAFNFFIAQSFIPNRFDVECSTCSLFTKPRCTTCTPNTPLCNKVATNSQTACTNHRGDHIGETVKPFHHSIQTKSGYRQTKIDGIQIQRSTTRKGTHEGSDFMLVETDICYTPKSI